MTGFKNPSPSNPTPKIVDEVLRPLPTRQLVRIRGELIQNPQFNATRIEVLDKILDERGFESLYSGRDGARCQARDHALHLAATHGIDPFCWSEKYGQMYATHVEPSHGTGLVTYKAASTFQ